MQIKLTCARCANVWTVTQWTPGALRCPACQGAELERGAHLTSGQRAAVATDLLPALEAEAKERQGKRNDLTLSKELDNVDPHKNAATEQAAQMMGMNRQYVSDAKRARVAKRKREVNAVQA